MLNRLTKSRTVFEKNASNNHGELAVPNRSVNQRA